MKTWIIEPRDSLVLRDGRLAADGVPMRCLPFPWPSSLAGLARTRAGLASDGTFRLTREEALAIEVRGPWLCELGDDDAPTRTLFPAPRDCVWFGSPTGPSSAGPRRRYRLAPAESPSGLSNLPDGLEVLQPRLDLPDGKPARGPRFWSFAEMSAWLANPTDYILFQKPPGMPGLTVEERTHVAIQWSSGTAEDGQLFSVEGLRFTWRPEQTGPVRRFALVLGCDDERLAKPDPALLGGEARLSSFTPGAAAAWPALPENLTPSSRRLRVVLVTPGIFANGFVPAGKAFAGARLVAAAVDRPQHISGWDFTKPRGGAPKKSRRMAPAGSVYWLEFATVKEAQTWARSHWMTCISDDEQDRRDGFGLCMVGVE